MILRVLFGVTFATFELLWIFQGFGSQEGRTFTNLVPRDARVAKEPMFSGVRKSLPISGPPPPRRLPKGLDSVVENSRKGKTYHKTLPRKWFWTPPPHLSYVFPFLFAHAMSFPLEEMGTDQTNPTFWGLQNWFWRVRSIVVLRSRLPPKTKG